jgi:YHS domain-containing protein
MTSVPMATDPVCGMQVSPEVAEAQGLTAEHEGTIYYFCGRAACSISRRTRPGSWVPATSPTCKSAAACRQGLNPAPQSAASRQIHTESARSDLHAGFPATLQPVTRTAVGTDPPCRVHAYLS